MSLILRKPKGATHKKKRRGIGNGSGHGGTSTKGNKGAQARKGYQKKIGFEGGQLPLIRRIPKRGFNNGLFRIDYQEVYLQNLNMFEDNTTINAEELFQYGIINDMDTPFKILANGTTEKKLEIVLRKVKKGKKFHKFDKITASAAKMIEEKGGKVVYQ